MKFSAIYLVLTCISFSILGQEWRTMYQEANQLYLNDNYADANDLAKKSLENYLKESGEANDNYAAILRLLANIAYAESNYDEGIIYMEKEITIRENKPDEMLAGALVNLSLFYQNTNNYVNAISTLERAEKILTQYYKDNDLSIIKCRLSLALNYYYSNENEMAFTFFNQNIPLLEETNEITYEDLIGFYFFGMLQFDRNEYDNALVTLLKAKEFFESADAVTTLEYAMVLSGIANTQHKLERYDESEAVYVKSQQLFETLEMTQDELYLSLLNNRATNLQALGQTDEAGKLLAQIQNNPAGKSTVAASLNNMASLSMAKGDFETAEKQYREALSNFNKDNPNEILKYVDTEENLALLKSQTGNFDDALLFSDEAVRLVKQQLGNDHPRVATSLNKRGRIKFSARDYTGASNDFNEALTLLTGRNDISAEAAVSLNGLGQCAQATSDYHQADIMYERALSLYDDNNFSKNRLYGIILNNYASSQLDQGNWADARDIEAKVTTLLGKLQGKNTSEYAEALENLAFLNLRLGELTEAKSQLDSVLTIFQTVLGVDSYEYAEAQMSLGRYFQYIGDYPQAEPLIKQSLQTIRSLKGLTSIPYANAQNTIALLFQTMGNYNEAEPLFKEALITYESKLGKASREYSTTLQNLASLYQLEEKYQLAEPLLKEVLTIDQALLGEAHPQYAVSLQNLATLYQKQKKFTEATTLLEQVKVIIEKTLGQKHPSYAVVISNLAALYQDKGEFDKAETQWKLSLSIRKNILGEDHPDYARSMYGLAGVYHATGKLNEAQPLYEEVVGKYQVQIKNYFSALSESEKGAFYNRIRPVFEAYQDFGIEFGKSNPSMRASYAGKLYDLQLSTKAILLNSSNKVRTSILSSGDQSLIDFYRQWQQGKEDLVKYYNFSSEERSERNIDLAELENQSNELEKRLTQLSTLFGTNYDQKKLDGKMFKNH
ncbi:MAG: tetratricopeptide repeat protein [Flammeovirgaceae bacterium]|nr:tetratricopeptide repeat protein [Flammeovirgaceae bacterium]